MNRAITKAQTCLLRTPYFIRGYCLVFCILWLLTSCVTTQTGEAFGHKNTDEAIEKTEALAQYYIRIGDWQRAKQHLKIAIDMGDQSPNLYQIMAMLYQQTHEREQAEQYYQKALYMDPHDSNIRLNYAIFLYDDARYHQAAQLLTIVGEDVLYPGRGVVFHYLGRCYRQLGQYEKAASAYHSAYLINPDNTDLTLELALVYFQLKSYSQSYWYYDAARKHNVPSRLLPTVFWLQAQLAAIFETDA